jgi:transposase
MSYLDKQEEIKEAVLSAALRKGANMVQIMAAQAGQGLKKVKLMHDRIEETGWEVNWPGGMAVRKLQPSNRAHLISLERSPIL